MKKSEINIVCATDNNYAPYCGIMLTSVFENNRDRVVSAYILLDKPLEDKEQRRFKRLSEKYGAQIHYVLVDKSFFERFPLKGYGVKWWSIVTYYRLYAASLLPQSVSNVLYLDCDIIVDKPIGELFDMDWDGYAVGAIPDMSIEWKEFYERLGYDRSEGYYNAGVLFMNLDYWRENKVGQQCIDYLTSNYDRIFNNDQDVLNVVTRHCKRTLPVSYNFQIQLIMPFCFNTFRDEMKKEVLNTAHPHIIHYASEIKPWMTRYYFYPFNKEWHKYKRMSPWKFIFDRLPPKRALNGFIKRYILWPVGIKVKKPAIVKR